MRFSRNVHPLRFSVQIEPELLVEVPVHNKLNVSRAQVWSWDSDLDRGRGTAQADGAEALADADPDLLVKVALVPLPVHPELSGGSADADLVWDAAVEEKVAVLARVERERRNYGSVAVDGDLASSLRLKTKLANLGFRHHAGSCLFVESAIDESLMKIKDLCFRYHRKRKQIER